MRVVQHSNSGHQLLLPPAIWCPIFASRTTQGRATFTFYELLHSDFEAEVGRLAAFLGQRPLTAAKLAAIARHVAFEQAASAEPTVRREQEPSEATHAEIEIESTGSHARHTTTLHRERAHTETTAWCTHDTQTRASAPAAHVRHDGVGAFAGADPPEGGDRRPLAPPHTRALGGCRLSLR